MTGLKKITGRQLLAAVAVSLLTVLFQIGAYRIMGAGTLDDHLRWDGEWYADIVRGGYQSALPPEAGNHSSNVAFFPGYPITARFAHTQFGLPVVESLVYTAILFALLTWFYVLLLMAKFGLNLRLRCIAYAILVAHPCSFFLITTYSESMFLALLLGYLFWGFSGVRWRWVPCALHGFGMTATRIAGLSFAPLFGIRRLLARRDSRSSLPARLARSLLSTEALVGYASCLGCLFFFVYIWRTFGHFDLYFRTGRIGWGITPNYLAFFTAGPFRESGFLIGVPSGARAVAWSLLSFLVLAAFEWRLYREKGVTDLFRRVRAPVYLCCLAMIYLIVSARHEVGYTSCMRYSLGWFFPQVLAAAALAREIGPSLSPRARAISFWTALAACIPSFCFQLVLMRRFFLDQWAS